MTSWQSTFLPLLTKPPFLPPSCQTQSFEREEQEGKDRCEAPLVSSPPRNDGLKQLRQKYGTPLMKTPSEQREKRGNCANNTTYLNSLNPADSACRNRCAAADGHVFCAIILSSAVGVGVGHANFAAAPFANRRHHCASPFANIVQQWRVERKEATRKGLAGDLNATKVKRKTDKLPFFTFVNGSSCSCMQQQQ